jgi:hypothetical protein
MYTYVNCVTGVRPALRYPSARVFYTNKLRAFRLAAFIGGPNGRVSPAHCIRVLVYG